jgi:hypothetical protein
MNHNDFTYCYLDLPHPPSSVIKDAFDALDKEHQKLKRNHPDTAPVEYLNTRSTYYVSKEFDQWIETYWQQTPISYGVHTSAENFSYHVDTNRNFSIRYVLDPGGDDVDTVWWQEKANSVARLDLKQNWNSTPKNPDSLDEIDRLNTQIHAWTCFNVNIIHSVEGDLQRPRIALQISAAELPPHINCYNKSHINFASRSVC